MFYVRAAQWRRSNLADYPTDYPTGGDGAEGPRKPRQEEFIRQSTEKERAARRDFSGDL